MIDKHPGVREAMPQVWNTDRTPSSVQRRACLADWGAAGMETAVSEREET